MQVVVEPPWMSTRLIRLNPHWSVVTPKRVQQISQRWKMETRSKNRPIQNEISEPKAVQDIEELYDQLTPFEPTLYDKELTIQFINYAL